MNISIKKGLLGAMGILSMYFYYIYYPFHGENKEGMFQYFMVLGILYGIYKLISGLEEKKTTQVSILNLILFFLLQLLVMCCCFFVFTTGNASYGLALFFKILFFLVPISLLWINFYCFGDTILKHIKYLGIESKKIQILSSLGIGFTIFMLGIFFLLSFSLYNLSAVIIFIILTATISYKSWAHCIPAFIKPFKSYDHDVKKSANFSQKYNLSLLIDELHYIVITFLISINLISVFRPFPIGWDDLGAYMNYPKLISGAGEHIALGKMYLWELYTGIGFLFGSQTGAFYMNSFSGIIAAIVIYISISALSEKKESSFDLGLFASMIILMMPMTVFQLAKDMKLDFGLLSISVIAMSLFYYAISSKKEIKYGIYILIGVFIAVAFSIKVTSLLLLLGLMGGMFYRYYGLLGFSGFIGVFVGIFSYLNLWSMMNVVISVDSEKLKIFSLLSIALGLMCFTIGHVISKNNSTYLRDFFIKIGAVLIGFILALSPWGIKHISEIPQETSIQVSHIVSGYGGFFKPDYTRLYNDSEINEIKNRHQKISEKGTTNNEDFGRYFGYEEGINNYLKLPWNLTFQTNQKGEFTDITYIFFALLPVLFLFLPYRKEIYKYPIIGVLVLSFIYFIPSPIAGYITKLFSLLTLPIGYFIIGAIFLAPLVFFHFTLDKNNKISQIFLINFAFSTIYVGLWAVSAFGIVWYGILMYFLFLVMITLCLLSIQSSETKQGLSSSYIVLIIVGVYVLYSAIPHGITNLKSAGYQDYKLGGFTEEVSLMTYHPEYFPILFELNISDESKQDMFIEYRNNLLDILDDTEFSDTLVPQIQSVSTPGYLNDVIKQIIKFDLKDIGANEAVVDLQQSLYESVIYPSQEDKNSQNILRIGTFLKYYISENNTRLFEDNLLMAFDNYIFDSDLDIGIERLQKLNVGHILLDLNAATIDQDPQRNLTQRYEDMLTFATSPDLTLVESDSICFNVALDTYKIDGNIGNYISMAGVNYSYKISSKQKKALCVQKIVNILQDENQLEKYPYLKKYIPALQNAGIQLDDSMAIGEALMGSIRNGYKALFKISQ